MGKQKGAKEAEKEVQKVELELCATKEVRTHITKPHLPFLQRSEFLTFENHGKIFSVLFCCWINIRKNLISNKLIRVKLREDVRRGNREETFANICAILMKTLPK